jgi:hypothetical protein
MYGADNIKYDYVRRFSSGLYLHADSNTIFTLIILFRDDELSIFEKLTACNYMFLRSVNRFFVVRSLLTNIYICVCVCVCVCVCQSLLLPFQSLNKLIHNKYHSRIQAYKRYGLMHTDAHKMTETTDRRKNSTTGIPFTLI